MSSDYDILVVGGGMVGASLARALAGSGLRLGVLEAVTPDASHQPSYDERVIALSWGSRVILEAMGRWPTLAPHAEPIERIHISDRGHFGSARLDCRDHGLPALGYVAPASAIGQALMEGVAGQADLDWLSPATLEDFRVESDRVLVQARTDHSSHRLQARLLVAADGGGSPIRERLGLPLQQCSYGHSAVVANLTPGRPHGGVAYERFTDTGPLAMLPMTGGRCSLVWTERDAALPETLALDDVAFLARLQRRFGFRLGHLQRVGRRSAYPLRLLRVRELARPRLVLIGNAAHTLHPVGGQGFNLGLRDVALLAELLVQAGDRGSDPGAPELLGRYAAGRLPDQGRVAWITDTLARLFVSPLPPVQLARNLGLLALDLLPPLKHGVTRQFLGLRGYLPRLARGLPLVGGPSRISP
jgi:2-octaprenyl-6-methoxyphenol hydroxylase